ncbi:glycosyltransferase family 4 protein [Maribacter sp. 2-571]|uniref:glycosyltransferase family 4 protein n=1 Tax=Maribacter sp. 2-571 TaxID=3417569 RepID=UPI003D35902E
MKKILFILHYPPPVHGAAKVGEYIKESTLINNSFQCRYINLGTSINVDEIGKTGFLKLKRYFSILVSSYVQLRKFKPDLVYLTLTTTGIGFFKDAMVVFLVKLFKVPVLFHFHNKGIKNKQNEWYYSLFYKKVFRDANAILLSPYLYDDVARYIPKEKVHYCANGIPEVSSTPVDHQKTENVKPVSILFLSNLIKSKGVNVLVHACKFLKDKNLDFECVFVGGEGDISVPRFRDTIDYYDVKDYVRYDGRKYGIEKEEAYRNADIFVLPTMYKNECFPLVLLEAMQYGLPVISTDEGGIPEIVEDGVSGFLIEKQSAQELSEKLAQLIKDSDQRTKMGREGRRRYLERFTKETFEKRFLEIISSL